tara:strand:- start:17 stop:1078 length:1062 start_codon:yes stop_codon:yes gene_type:complete
MTARATPESVRAIMRRKEKQEQLNILTFCTHERYEQQLCKTGHQFYAIKSGKLWDTDYGEIPDNYHPLTKFPSGVDFDLVLCHTACDRLQTAFKIRDEFNIPIALHTHVLPDVRFNVVEQVENYKGAAEPVDSVSFISEYNMKQWGFNKRQSTVVEHGIDYDFWSDEKVYDRDKVCLSVVNDWANRDWCCGWKKYNDVMGKYVSAIGDKVDMNNMKYVDKVKPLVVGKNPGISEPAASIEELRRIYHGSLIYLNTSLHSPVPTALMEAMACGCVIISTNNCMIPEIIKHGQNGLLSNEVEELQRYIERVESDPDLAKELGFNAQQTIREQYSLSRFTDSWNDLFYNTINNYKG